MKHIKLFAVAVCALLTTSMTAFAEKDANASMTTPIYSHADRWHAYGNPDFYPAGASSVKLAFGWGTDRPYAAFIGTDSKSGGRNFSVYTLNNKQWVPLFNQQNPAPLDTCNLQSTAIAVGPSGNPYILGCSSDGKSIGVMKFDFRTYKWTQVGNDISGQNIMYPSLVVLGYLGSQSTAYLFYVSVDANNHSTLNSEVLKPGQQTWAPFTAVQTISNGRITKAAFALHSYDGKEMVPCVSYVVSSNTTTTTTNALTTMCYSNNSWAQVGDTISNDAGFIGNVSLAFDGSDVPYIGYIYAKQQGDAAGSVIIEYLANNHWSMTPSIRAYYEKNLNLAISSSGQIYITYTDLNGAVTARNLTSDDGWHYLGQSQFCYAKSTSLAINPIDNLPYLLYTDMLGGGAVSAEKYTPPATTQSVSKNLH